MYGACKKNHGVGEGKVALDGCVAFVGKKPGDSQCAACGCHVGFHVQPQASHELAAIRVDPQDLAFGACLQNLAAPNARNITIHDGCQRFFPSSSPKNPNGDKDGQCGICGCAKSMHEAFCSTFAGDAALKVLVPGSNLPLKQPQ